VSRSRSRSCGRSCSRADERGSGSMIMIGVVALVMTVAWGATVIAGYLVAGHRASSVADLAALSGASAQLSGGDACDTADRMAHRQHATARCQLVGDRIDFVITVTAEVRVPVALPGLPSRVRAIGHAGPTSTGAATSEQAGR
jgi:secretion/DNA translocation related TadE-like protein